MTTALRIGVDLGGTKTEAIALGEGGNELARRRVATPQGSYDGTIRTIRDLVATLETELGVSAKPPQAASARTARAASARTAQAASATVGIGIPGTISPRTGLIKNANSTWLIGKPFDRDLAAALGRPVRLANDADCFALSEASDGAGAGAATVFGVILGTGVGGGIVIGGRLLAGPNAIAGEWGHNPLPWPSDAERPGARCYCGKNGCIETFLSGPGLARDHGGSLSGADIAALAAAGDADALAALERYQDRLARALATVINVIDPDVVVLGGGVSKLTRLYDTVPRLWGRYVFSDAVATRLAPPVHGDSSGVRGAAWLWPDEPHGLA